MTSKNARVRRIMIVGGGIGGLTAALALMQRGFEVRVFEQAPLLGEVGAGLTLLPSAMRSFESLGIWSKIQEQATRASSVAVLHYQTGELIAGNFDQDWVSHPPSVESGGHAYRADIHAILAQAVLSQNPRGIALDHQLVAVDQDSFGVRAIFKNGVSAQGDLLIAGDGLRSSVRTLLFDGDKPTFAGQVAFRFMIPTDGVKPYLSAGRGANYIGPKCAFLRYGVRRGSLLNCVAIAQSDQWREEGWSIRATRDEVRAKFPGWHADVMALIDHAPPDRLFKWALFDRSPLPTWRNGRVALLGDAAHPMLPFLGLGAASAVEDGIVIARALSEYSDFGEALQRYEEARKPRTSFIAEQSRRQGQVVQSDRPWDYLSSSPRARDPSIISYNPLIAAL